MMWKICFDFIENPTFRTDFEFSPAYRIVQMVATSSIIPFPTTLIGTLYSILVEMNINKIDLEKLRKDIRLTSRCLQFIAYEHIENALGLSIHRFYGPYVEVIREGSNPVKKRFVAVSKFGINDALMEVKNGRVDLESDVIFVMKETRTGIELEKVRKTVKQGYLYTLEKIPLRNASICIDLLTSNESQNNILQNADGAIVGLGTKKALARIRIAKNGDSLYAEVTRKVKLLKGYRGMLISPAIILDRDAFGLIRGEIALSSLGYSLAKNIKRPVVPIIKTGSIVELNCNETHIGELKKYAFGSVILI